MLHIHKSPYKFLTVAKTCLKTKNKYTELTYANLTIIHLLINNTDKLCCSNTFSSSSSKLLTIQN